MGSLGKPDVLHEADNRVPKRLYWLSEKGSGFPALIEVLSGTNTVFPETNTVPPETRVRVVESTAWVTNPPTGVVAWADRAFETDWYAVGDRAPLVEADDWVAESRGVAFGSCDGGRETTNLLSESHSVLCESNIGTRRNGS